MRFVVPPFSSSTFTLSINILSAALLAPYTEKKGEEMNPAMVYDAQRSCGVHIHKVDDMLFVEILEEGETAKASSYHQRVYIAISIKNGVVLVEQVKLALLELRVLVFGSYCRAVDDIYLVVVVALGKLGSN